MRILVTGAGGMLGRTLLRTLSDTDLVPCRREDADVTDAGSVNRFFRRSSPDVVIHCAAMTAVDRCETDREAARLANEAGSRNVARACRGIGARLVAVSTDYVFRGDLDRPYTERDPADGGLTVYGQTKFAGEEAVRRECPDHVIARVSWLYGPGGPSFVHTILRLSNGTRPVLRVVDDQLGNPTSTDAVASCLRGILERPDLRGTFHVTCEGEASWYDFARRILELAGVAQAVAPCSTSEYPRPAPRPANSRLEKAALREAGLPPMPHWEDALRDFLAAYPGL